MNGATTDLGADPVDGGAPSDGVAFVDRPFPAPPADAASLTFSVDLRHVRIETRTWAEERDLPARVCDDLVLTVDELAANSMRHGGGRGELRLWIDDGGTAVAQVADRGW